MDESSQRLLFYSSSPDAKRTLKVPLHALRHYGRVTVRRPWS